MMRRIERFVALLAVLGPAFGGAAVHAQDGRIRHVIHISIDGLRGDLLQGLLDTQPDSFAGLARLRAQGAATFNARCDHGSSSTNPNHTSMLTGLPLHAAASAPAWQQHGYAINYAVASDTLHADGHPVGYKWSVFDRVHDRGGHTLFLASKTKFALFDRSYDALHGAPDLVGEDNGSDKIDFAFIKNGDSSILVSVLISRMGEELPEYTFMHIFDPDYAGHLNGWGSMAWQLAVKHADSLINLVLAALELRPALMATTALIVTADHGGGVPPNTHVDPTFQENYTIPMMLWGPGVPPATDAYSLFANRGDPGSARPENDAVTPPLRNGDTGNIALALLGLPPVTDSFYRPEWAADLRVTTAADGSVECSWPLYLTGWSLERSPSLHEQSWLKVSEDPTAVEGRWRHTEPAPAVSASFYRLRAPR